MKRAILLLALAVALVLLAGGCNKGAIDTPADTAATTEVVESTVVLEGFDAMPTDGANESAALAAVPGAFAAEKASGSWIDVDWAALEAVEPRLVAYLVRVDLGGQVALFEVRADGIAHNIYGYQRAFDSGSMIWTPVADQQSATATPASAGEIGAATAVDAAMRDAFPDGAYTVVMHGYRFAYLADGLDPFVIEVAPDGGLISAGM